MYEHNMNTTDSPLKVLRHDDNAAIHVHQEPLAHISLNTDRWDGIWKDCLRKRVVSLAIRKPIG